MNDLRGYRDSDLLAMLEQMEQMQAELTEKDTDHTSIRERTTAASDLIRMAERAGADARANDAASGAVIKDSQTGRAYREAERERQDSERQRKIKARKRGIDR